MAELKFEWQHFEWSASLFIGPVKSSTDFLKHCLVYWTEFAIQSSKHSLTAH